MPVQTSPKLIFLPWVRQGAAAGIQAADTLASQPGRVELPIKLRVNNADEISLQARLYGPGDVTGIDPQQIVRVEPRPGATDFEPNYFPLVEFDRPDFLWLFTPARANADGCLRPWLCLIVVRQQEGVTLRNERGLPLPVLDIKAPAQPSEELPDLSESWAWAHAQVTGVNRERAQLTNAINGNPEWSISRLLCPRRLAPHTAYLACVVPAFELGRKAGLNLEIKANDPLDPAWILNPPPPAQISLPVYFHWQFRTGENKDFETLVALLQPRPLPAGVGKLPLDISQPGFKLAPELPADAPGLLLEMEGALRAPQPIAPGEPSPPSLWPEPARTVFQNKLKEIINAPAQYATAAPAEPLLAPPIYGAWHAARQTAHSAPPATAWLDQLNLDPRHRVAAAVGVRVVQDQQEALMAAAWEQLGQIEQANQALRQAQLSRAINLVFHAKHLARLSEAALLQVVAPAQTRVMIAAAAGPNAPPDRLLLARQLTTQVRAAVSAPLRRLARPRGAVNRHAAPVTAPARAGNLVSRLSPGMSTGFNNRPAIFIFKPVPQGAISANLVSQALGQQPTRPELATKASIEAAPPRPNFSILPEGTPLNLDLLITGSADSPIAANFRQAAAAHQEHLHNSVRHPPSFHISPVPSIKTSLLQALAPEANTAARLRAKITLNPEVAVVTQPPLDPLEPLMASPYFTWPMAEELGRLAQNFLLPGLEHVPPNTATLVQTNARFIEAFMVGLNVEMNRELLWRGYPTDQRGTSFRYFWQTPANLAPRPDVPPLREWLEKALGQNLQEPAGGNRVVLLLRSELLRRYPNTIIYAARATATPGELGSEERHPILRGALPPDVVFLGFNLTAAEAKTEPGWYFVIEEQPAEPRFGLDATAETDTPARWNQLSWEHPLATGVLLNTVTHLPIKDKPAAITQLEASAHARWGKNSAHMAYITAQQPMRIAIHARDMLRF